MTLRFTRRSALSGLGKAAALLLFRSRIASGLNAGTGSNNVGPVGLELSLRAVSDKILRITLAAVAEPYERIYDDGSLAMKSWPEPRIRAKAGDAAQSAPWADKTIDVQMSPLRVAVRRSDNRPIQELLFDTSSARISFGLGDVPLYGLGGGVPTLDRRGTSDDMRSGQFGPQLATFGARLPIPWLISPRGWGLFFHEPWGHFDLSDDVGVFKSEEAARAQDVFLVLGDSPAELLRQWAELTGYPHLPPIWALGYQQSHRTLAGREEVLQEAKTFRDKKLPCDTLIYLGTGFCPSGWNTGHGSFAFNENVFPDPAGMIAELHGNHFKVILHVTNPPLNLHGKVGDLETDDPEDAGNYWKLHDPLDRIGVDGWWPDEGDPLEKAVRLTRNRMYWEGDKQSRPNARPFALHRNGYAGLQRYGWLWSGDVQSTWKTLAAQVMEGINAGLCGIPYWGTDIGGFVPTKEFTAELYLRWFQFGAFCPLFRSHGRTWKLRLPWGWNLGNYGPAELNPQVAASVLPGEKDLHNGSVEQICRKYLNTRYQLLPYIYSAFDESHTTGIPIMRALWLDNPDDRVAQTTADEYLFGPSLLVAPVVESGAMERELYLPAGQWWDFWTSTQATGGTRIKRSVDLETMPVFVKAGTILPTGPVRQFATEASSEPVTLTIYPGVDGTSFLYEDDGASFDYERGDFQRIEMQWIDSKRQLHLKSHSGKRVARRFRIARPGAATQDISFDGTEVTLQL